MSCCGYHLWVRERRAERLLSMAVTNARRIVIADRMNDGVVIKFDDGKCAFYPCTLLYATFAKCEELNEKELQW